MKAEYIGDNSAFTIDIDCDNDDIESIKVDGAQYDLDFLIEIAPDFVDWCEEQVENSPVKDNPYFEND